MPSNLSMFLFSKITILRLFVHWKGVFQDDPCSFRAQSLISRLGFLNVGFILLTLMPLLRTRCCPLQAIPVCLQGKVQHLQMPSKSINHSTPLPSSSLPFSAAPSPIVQPLDSQSSSDVSYSISVSNPLVRAGLIPPELADLKHMSPSLRWTFEQTQSIRKMSRPLFYEGSTWVWIRNVLGWLWCMWSMGPLLLCFQW